MTKCEQLDALVQYYAGGNKSQFARMLGIIRQNLNTWYKYNSMDYDKVFRACPGVSAEWLLTGDGEMLNENRKPNLYKNDRLTPILSEGQLKQGDWSDSENFVLTRGQSGIECDFLTRAYTGDLSYYIRTNSPIGCNLEYLYIILTKSQSLLFLEFLSSGLDENGMYYRFTTHRSNPDVRNMKIEIPEDDIDKCAEIVWYGVDHEVDNVI